LHREPPRTVQSYADMLEFVPEPILFNAWKHHAGFLRQSVAAAVSDGPVAVRQLPRQLAVVGDELMHLYTGHLSPRTIALRVLDQLRADNRQSLHSFRQWLATGAGYQVLTLAPDGSCWVVRMGESDRYVHVHPGRRTPDTRRVRANVLKTAIMVSAHVGVHGGDPLDVVLINHVRNEY